MQERSRVSTGEPECLLVVVRADERERADDCDPPLPDGPGSRQALERLVGLDVRFRKELTDMPWGKFAILDDTCGTSSSCSR
jgi:hypothetical protein